MLSRDIWQHKNQKYKEQEITELWLSVLFLKKILQEVFLLIHCYIKQFLKILLNVDRKQCIKYGNVTKKIKIYKKL